ncbi:hypothetical protein HOI26_02270 [Candidatus Woesearchaeota archaeon]|mgnify:FL=1|jgi:hypothetical protein|nr:hypothetical protein [Candidatus Woesearchaeota archaeon]MBT5739903.1 hypothetical protein [Candidatus Woesearchaeota archaeon]
MTEKGKANFVSAMLESAEKTKETKAQTRFDHVDEDQLQNFMAKLQKGKTRE